VDDLARRDEVAGGRAERVSDVFELGGARQGVAALPSTEPPRADTSTGRDILDAEAGFPTRRADQLADAARGHAREVSEPRSERIHVEDIDQTR
jgi:hypothetical protein